MKLWAVGLILFGITATAAVPSRIEPGAIPDSLSSGPRTAASRVPSAAGHVELLVDTTKTFYHLYKTSRRGLWEEIRRKAPVHESRTAVGLTSWHVRWKYDPERSSEGLCQIQQGEVHVSVEITLPRWEGYGSAPAPLRKQWRDYYRALVRHERRHQTLIIKAGRRLRRALDRLQASSCMALRQKAKRRGQRIHRRAMARNERFDEREEFSL